MKAALVLLIGLLLLLKYPILSIAEAAHPSGQYQVIDHWPLPGTGGSSFLFLDTKQHQLYLSRDNQVTVLNTSDGSVKGEITGLTDARGIALSFDGKVGYIGDGVTGTLKVFSIPTLTITSSMNIGGTPEAVVVDPVSGRIFVFDSHNNAVVVVDPSSLQKVGTLKLPGRPASATVGGDGTIFVNLNSTGQLAQINPRSLTLQKVIPLKPCVGPSGIAVDAMHARIFSVCENKLMAVSDSHSGELITTVPIGEGAKTVAFDSADRFVVSANGEGTISVVKEQSATSYSPLATIKTKPGARTMVYDSDRRQLYLISSKYGQRPGPTSEELQFRPTPAADTSVVIVMKP